MTVKEAAEALGLSVATVYQLIADCKIRHERHGAGRGTIRLTIEALDEYRESVTVAPVRREPGRRYKHLT
jgi:excisionase family DNA binding protein